MNSLQQYELDEFEKSELAEELFSSGADHFAVNDLNQANWCFRKLAALQVKRAEVVALADAERARIEAWQTNETAGLQRGIEFFEALLANFHARQLSADPKAKTITTPYGKLKSTTRKPSPVKVDEAALLQHLKESGDAEFIVVKETPAWGEYKKTLSVQEVQGTLLAIDQNGMPVEGVEVDAGGTTFKVEVDA